MRAAYFALTLLLTLTVLYLLSRPFGSVPPIGSFLSPHHGFWQNAEDSSADISEYLAIAGLSGDAEVYFDERLVPHIYADHERDAFLIQGYLHARFRLWQMEFQTFAAAGRLAEVLGPGPDSALLRHDRQMRRMGMVYGARIALAEIQKDDETRMALEAYTEGVNLFVDQLSTATLPLEYRLLHYRPERWTPLKTALFLKYMSYDLTGADSELGHTRTLQRVGREAFEQMFPRWPDSLDPIIPRGTVFMPPGLRPEAPPGWDSLIPGLGAGQASSFLPVQPVRGNGSNNWAVAGSRTSSGYPILCNDPHLGLNLPALWYEMQITTPRFSAYGVSFPGAPAIIIGFNDSLAWGVTNASRDVRDLYALELRDDPHKAYRYEGGWRPLRQELERIRVKGGPDFVDTVWYSDLGPVLFDVAFPGDAPVSSNTAFALRWTAHDPSNELRTFLRLNRAQNLAEGLQAIESFVCPGQNFVLASPTDGIALQQQGAFPVKWPRQGQFLMPGHDSAWRWQGFIPTTENPRVVNPARGFVSSANQLPADSLYPYDLAGDYDLYRGRLINRFLGQMEQVTPEDMQRLQTNNLNGLAETALPVMLRELRQDSLNPAERHYADILRSWNRQNDPDLEAPVIFSLWFEELERSVWGDDLTGDGPPPAWPQAYTLAELMLRDPASPFFDDRSTPQVEQLGDIVTRSMKAASQRLERLEKDDQTTWSVYKDAGVRHLLRLGPFSALHLVTGGGVHVINALKQFHGPSWRMVIHMKPDPEGYGQYPGGQSGNPGSKYYDRQVRDWAAGRYYPLRFWRKGEAEKASRQMIRFLNEEKNN